MESVNLTTRTSIAVVCKHKSWLSVSWDQVKWETLSAFASWDTDTSS